MSDKRKNKKSRLTPLKVVLLILIVLAEVGILGFVLHRHSAEPRQDPIVSAPAVEEQTEPTPQPIDYSTDAAALRISEVMAKNTATLMAEDGSFPDWLEISNSSYNSISLNGWSLSDGKGRWTFPDLSIAPGEYLFLYAGAETGLSTGFSLSEGETLTFSDPNGNTVDEVTLYPVNSNRSLIRAGDGTFREADYTTPGFENSVNGFEKACEDAFSPAGPLVISEICTANTDFNRKIEDEYADWVELHNISSEPVNLSGYFLSDKKDNKLLFSLPEKTLAGGEYILIYCSKDYTSLKKESPFILAPFSLGTDADQLWLSDANGNVLDYAALWQLPINGSYGREDSRNGWFYYTVSTPEKANTGGCRRIADTPVASVGSGQFNGVESISVELSVQSGRGKVYYTTGDEVTEMKLQKIISLNIPVLLLSLPQQFCVHLRRRTEPAPAVSQPTAIISTKTTHSLLSASWRTAFPSSMASTIPVTSLSNVEEVFPLSKTAPRSFTVPVRSGSKALPLCWTVLKRTTESTSLTAMAVLTLKGWISSIPGSQHGPHFSFVPDRTGHMTAPVFAMS